MIKELRLGILVFFLVSGFWFLVSDTYAQTESITLTTYYPSPYGSYNQLQASTLAVGDVNADGVLNAADLPGNGASIAGNAGVLNLVGGDHAYIQWYPDGFAAGRKGWTGWEDATAVNFTVANEIAGANIILRTNGGNVGVIGSFSATGAKSFEIAHPTKPGMKLVHSTLEGPEVAVFYRGEEKLANGEVIVELPEYFESLTRKEKRTVQLTAKGTQPFLLSYTNIVNGSFKVYGTRPDGEFSWEVKAIRADIPPLVVERLVE